MSDATAEATETTTETTAVQTVTEATETAAAEKDWKAEAEKWKSFARKHEDAAKANAEKAKRLDEFEESQKSEMQKAADRAAKAEADAATTSAKLAQMQAAVKHGLTADDLELLGTHGTPEEIEARAERLAARLKAAEDAKPKPDFGAGDRGTDVATTGGQLSADDIKRMTPEQIVAAKAAGRFDGLLKRT